MSDLACRIAGLHVHPIKSLAGVSPHEALLIETGLEFDRAWMVVDEQGEMRTQRELPRMALVRPQFRADDLVLRAPGMLALHLRLDAVEAATRARVWDDEVKAYDMGALAAQWMSDFLGERLRLVRFDPEHKRLSDKKWTGDVEAENAFSDGYPLLVAGTASLADLNARLAARGAPAVGIERFRPNLVLEGLAAFEEDHVDELAIDTDEGPVRLRLVKPCVRCTIPDVDPATAERGTAVGDTLASFRADARMGGGLTFGMNAVVLGGIEKVLRVGQAVRASIRF
ncbi:MAG: MOSC N-terminal beta barrel domain-containing protein [Burkholderiales bacterium]|nr:MOSC N-terminal beta barrel domain-containing protein [Burkholderiales bacterium]